MWQRLILILCSFVFFVNCDKNVSVIIIGAGSSGIAAASKLIENGFTNIKILEAEDRIGGRINSVHFGDAYVDVGAEWCQGETGNIVYSLVKDLNVLKVLNYSYKVYCSNRESLDEQLMNEVQLFIYKFGQTAFKPIRPDVSQGEQYETLFRSTILDKYKNDAKKNKILQSSIDYAENMLLSYKSAFSWYDVSYNNTFERSEGTQQITWNGKGFKTILDVLLKKIPDPAQAIDLDDKLILSKEISKVNWSKDPQKQVTIETADGEHFNSNHVIFTPSLGVLKAQHESLFEPKLPDEKKVAIENIGFGACMKVIMHFPEVWWDPAEISYTFMWHVDDKFQIPQEFKDGPIKNKLSWVHSIISIYQSADNPNVMIAWFSGYFVPDLEKISDDVILDGIMFSMKKFLGGRFNVTKPDKILRSKWFSNSHFRGTYSYDTPKGIAMNENLHEVLSLPLTRTDGTPAVLFAGEATSPNHYSVVNGAIETGYREAQRIIDLYAHI